MKPGTAQRRSQYNTNASISILVKLRHDRRASAWLKSKCPTIALFAKRNHLRRTLQFTWGTMKVCKKKSFYHFMCNAVFWNVFSNSSHSTSTPRCKIMPERWRQQKKSEPRVPRYSFWAVASDALVSDSSLAKSGERIFGGVKRHGTPGGARGVPVGVKANLRTSPS